MTQRKRRKPVENGRSVGLDDFRQTIAKLSEIVATLSPYPSHLKKRMIAALVIDAWESVHLFAPAEAAQEQGKWLSELIGQVNGYCAGCGRIDTKGLCKVCVARERTDIAGEGGHIQHN